MENNKVNVKIYGQEYTISGEESRDQIIKIADYVDSKMTSLSGILPSGPVAALAILSAVNIAEEFFAEKGKLSYYEGEITRLRKDAYQFEQLWEETKRSFSHFKEELKTAKDENQELKRLLEDKNKEIASLKNDDKYKELESIYFDLEMENLRLKNELEKKG